jgi:hypothetical protein
MRWCCNERKPNDAIARDGSGSVRTSTTPAGLGLPCFNDLAVAAVTEIDRIYAQHMRGGCELAQECFSSEKWVPTR